MSQLQRIGARRVSVAASGEPAAGDDTLKAFLKLQNGSDIRGVAIAGAACGACSASMLVGKVPAVGTALALWIYSIERLPCSAR